MSITYFQATENNLQSVIDLRIAFLLEWGGPQTEEAIAVLRRGLEISFLKGMKNQTYLGWLATIGDRLAGSGGIVIREHPGNFINPSGKSGYLFSMYTVPEFRGRGICSTLVNKLVESAEQMGIRAFELHASKLGEPVYKKQGFIIHDEPTYRKYLNR